MATPATARKGKLQTEYGLLTDPPGRPIAVRVFPGNTGDPTAFVEALSVVRDTFGLRQMVMVGDRGMITSARIDALRKLPTEDGFGWLTCLRAPPIAALAAERARKRADLLTATEDLLAPIVTAVAEGRLHGAAAIGLRIGKLVDKYKMAKHLDITITDTTVTITRRQVSIDGEAALDGIYVIRTSVPADQLDPASIVLTLA